MSDVWDRLREGLDSLRTWAKDTYQAWVLGNPDEAGRRVSTVVTYLRGLREEVVYLETLSPRIVDAAERAKSEAITREYKRQYVAYAQAVFGCVQRAAEAMYGREAAAKLFEGKLPAGQACPEVGNPVAIPAGYVIIGLVATCTAISISAAALGSWRAAHEERLRQQQIIDARKDGVYVDDIAQKSVNEPSEGGGLLLALALGGVGLWFLSQQARSA